MTVFSAGNPSGQVPTSFEIKSARLPLLALMLKTANIEVLITDLLQQFGAAGETPDFFDQDALLVDFSQLTSDLPAQAFEPLLKCVRDCRLLPVAVRGKNVAWLEIARQLGLAQVGAELLYERPMPPTQPVMAEVVREVIHQVVHEVAGPATMVIDKPLRSGQKVYARGADLVVLAMVNQGAEVVADGNIHVYAPLRGKAMAGASGNTHARIFSLCLEPELISIAGVYRTSETPLAAEIHGKPAQVRLSQDGQEKLLFEALNA